MWFQEYLKSLSLPFLSHHYPQPLLTTDIVYQVIEDGWQSKYSLGKLWPQVHMLFTASTRGTWSQDEASSPESQ